MAPPETMTSLQLRTLMYIENYWKNQGVGPTYREMSLFFQCSVITVFQRCDVLIGLGYLVKMQETRSISVTDKGRLQLTRRDNVAAERAVVKYLVNLSTDLRVPLTVRTEIGTFLKGNHYETKPIERARPGSIDYRTQ